MPIGQKKIKSIFLTVLATIYLKNLKKSKWTLVKNTIDATNAINNSDIINLPFNKQTKKRKTEKVLRNIEIRDCLFELSLLQYKAEFLIKDYTQLNIKIWNQKYRCTQTIKQL